MSGPPCHVCEFAAANPRALGLHLNRRHPDRACPGCEKPIAGYRQYHSRACRTAGAPKVRELRLLGQVAEYRPGSHSRPRVTTERRRQVVPPKPAKTDRLYPAGPIPPVVETVAALPILRCCGRTYDQWARFDHHQRLYHPAPAAPVAEPGFPCGYCPQRFTAGKRLAGHLATAHGVKVVKLVDEATRLGFGRSTANDWARNHGLPVITVDTAVEGKNGCERIVSVRYVDPAVLAAWMAEHDKTATPAPDAALCPACGYAPQDPDVGLCHSCSYERIATASHPRKAA